MSPRPTDSLTSPLEDYDQSLIAQVHPSDWVNPIPAERYDLVVIGAGTAGLVVAAGAAGLGLGLKVALIEKHLMGGDCLNVGCVPSKCMIRASRVVAEIRDGERFGVQVNGAIAVDFPAVMARMRQIRAEISPNDSADRLKTLGVDIFFGQGQFRDRHTIQVEGAILRFKKAVIATGARASHPPIPGLAEAGFLTNETVFNLTDRPARFAVIGGGPIGCELAQTFQRLGSEVVLLHKNGHLLDREDADAAEIIQQVFIQEGIQLQLNAQLQRVEKNKAGKVLHFTQNGQSASLIVDEILIGAGRSPNVEGLNLDQVGVNYDPRTGVWVNDYLQTTNPNIYAAGDICLDWKFTHAADAAARIVLKNTLFSPLGVGRAKLSRLVMPWSTYTSPEIAHVGLYPQDAIAKGLEVEVIHIPFSTVDRAITDGENNGFIKILHQRGSDQILGATIVSAHAGDLISTITLAITAKIGLSQLSTVIYPYPTQVEAIKKAADAYRRTLLTPQSKALLGLLARLG